MSFAYLATPYSHPDEDVRIRRYEAAMEVTAFLLREGHIVFSPIVHSHPLAQIYVLPAGFDFWQGIDFAMLEKANLLIVCMMEGWEESKGVQAEITYATHKKIPIGYVKHPIPDDEPIEIVFAKP